MADFSTAYNITSGHEGGYANLTHDSGGETYKGIARNYNRNWAGWVIIDNYKQTYANGIIPRYTIFKNADLDAMVKNYYFTEYWNKKARGGEILSQGMANLVYDMIVNHGRGAQLVNEAIVLAHGAVLAIKNSITNETLHWLNSNAENIYPYIIRRREQYYRSLPTFSKDGDGWLNRLASFPSAIAKAILPADPGKKKSSDCACRHCPDCGGDITHIGSKEK